MRTAERVTVSIAMRVVIVEETLVTAAKRRWSVNAYARNVTNTDYLMATFGTSPVAFGGRPAAPRQFALELAVRHE